MSGTTTDGALEMAVELSWQLVSAADIGDVDAVTKLDAERLQLLQSLHRKDLPLDATESSLLQVIAQLNDRALGMMEHRHRMKAREVDLAAVGRRAVSAYRTNR